MSWFVLAGLLAGAKLAAGDQAHVPLPALDAKLVLPLDNSAIFMGELADTSITRHVGGDLRVVAQAGHVVIRPADTHSLIVEGAATFDATAEFLDSAHFQQGLKVNEGGDQVCTDHVPIWIF
ncbi:hypothetical protein T492DRAFT_874474 [Pavlovales sp. CCMP2436]|nr:hypothetical protein T492DRAFT_874474 [Pavlovales sp. CCMP2436]